MRLMHVAAKLGALAVVVTFATSSSQPAMAGRAAYICNDALLYCKYGQWQGLYASFAECLREESELRCPFGEPQYAPNKPGTALWIDPKKTAA